MERQARFEQMYSANYEPLLAYAMRRTATGDDAFDIVAETFLVAWRRLDEVPIGKETRLWLFGVARMVLANHRRGQRRYERLGASLQALSPVFTAAPAAPVGIGVAFGRLSCDDREILMLVAVEGLAPREIAKVLGISSVAVRVRLHRARARFAAELGAEGIEL